MKYIKYILSIVIPFLIAYLLGCFTNVSFSISEWTENSRIAVCVFGTMGSISIFAMTFLFNLE